MTFLTVQAKEKITCDSFTDVVINPSAISDVSSSRFYCTPQVNYVRLGMGSGKTYFITVGTWNNITAFISANMVKL